jgi:hypothetical protein
MDQQAEHQLDQELKGSEVLKTKETQIRKSGVQAVPTAQSRGALQNVQ